MPIVGIYANDHGHSYIVHTCCGQQVQLNAVLHVKKKKFQPLMEKRLQWFVTLLLMELINGIEFLRCTCASIKKYNYILIKVKDVVLSKDSNASCHTLFHWFCGYIKAAVIKVMEGVAKRDKDLMRKKAEEKANTNENDWEKHNNSFVGVK